jgi:hypothetical protein
MGDGMSLHGTTTLRPSKRLKLCVVFRDIRVFDEATGWDGTSSQVRTDGDQEARARMPRCHRLCQLCSTDGATFQNAQRLVEAVLKMSGTSC